MRSGSASRPIESRIRPSLMPAVRRASASIPACVMVAGLEIRLSTPPRGLRKCEELDDVYKATYFLDAAGQFEAQHNSKSSLLGLSDDMARMGFQARIMDGADQRIPIQKCHRRVGNARKKSVQRGRCEGRR